MERPPSKHRGLESRPVSPATSSTHGSVHRQPEPRNPKPTSGLTTPKRAHYALLSGAGTWQCRCNSHAPPTCHLSQKLTCHAQSSRAVGSRARGVALGHAGGRLWCATGVARWWNCAHHYVRIRIVGECAGMAASTDNTTQNLVARGGGSDLGMHARATRESPAPTPLLTTASERTRLSTYPTPGRSQD
jgi:hypothetical protein